MAQEVHGLPNFWDGVVVGVVHVIFNRYKVPSKSVHPYNISVSLMKLKITTSKTLLYDNEESLKGTAL